MRPYHNKRSDVTEAFEYQLLQAESNIAWAERVGIPLSEVRERLLALIANGRGSLRSGPNGSGRGIDRIPVLGIKVRVRELHTENELLRQQISEAENEQWRAA